MKDIGVVLLVVLSLVLIFNVGCAPVDVEILPTPTIQPGNGEIPGYIGSNSVTRYIDKEAGAVCWVYSGYNKGGISCLPISETNLDLP